MIQNVDFIIKVDFTRVTFPLPPFQQQPNENKRIPQKKSRQELKKPEPTSRACLWRCDFLNSLEICRSSEADIRLPSPTHFWITLVALRFGCLSLKILLFKSSPSSTTTASSTNSLPNPPEGKNLRELHWFAAPTPSTNLALENAKNRWKARIKKSQKLARCKEVLGMAPSAAYRPRETKNAREPIGDWSHSSFWLVVMMYDSEVRAIDALLC